MKQKLKTVLKRTGMLYLVDAILKGRWFSSRFHFRYLSVDFQRGTVLEANTPEIDEELLKGLIRFVKTGLETVPTGQWAAIFQDSQAAAIKYIYDEDVRQLQHMLQNPMQNNLQYGFDNLARDLQSPFRLETLTERSLAADHIVALAEYCGVIRMNSPEACLTPKKKRVDAVALLEEVIDRCFPKGTVLPNPYVGERGVLTRFGVASLRVPSAMYQALRVRDLGSRICEIGPGLGRTAYFARLLGASSYTLVDLPISSLSQGYYLGRALPADRVSFSENSEADAEIKFQSPSSFLRGTETFDVVLNVDSLTEIGIDAARNYLRSIVGRTRFFYSINHECNEFCVRELIAAEFPEYKTVFSSRSWVRQGYIEELYTVSGLL